MIAKENLRLALLLFALGMIPSACTMQVDHATFWEGPHPWDPTMKFYIEITPSSDNANGYWTKDGFYASGFPVELLKYDQDSIRFVIPGWGCTYEGAIRGDSVAGGFTCEGEPYDAVPLLRNNGIRKYLTEARPAGSERFRNFATETPAAPGGIPKAAIRSAQDSAFFFNLYEEIAAGQYGRINSLIFIRGDSVRGETYFYGYDASVLHAVESCTKSITSLLIGIAIDNGFIGGTNVPLRTFFPEYARLQAEPYRGVTLEHLLTMTPGFEPADDAMVRSPASILEALERPITAQPGEEFRYDGANTELLGAVLARATGLDPELFARKYLFEPLGISAYDWSKLEQDTLPCMSGSLKLAPLDFAKIGLLVLNKGRFEGEQVVSEAWMQQSTKAQIDTGIDGDAYGFQWWVITMETGKRSYEVIWANGWGSQFIFIIPELDMVLVTTGNNYEYDSWAIREGVEKNLHLLSD